MKKFNSSKPVAAISGLLVSSLLAVGCSSQKSVPVSSETQASTNQAILNQPVTPAPIATTNTTPTPAPAKKIVKKRPASTVTYKDDAYNLSFRYPRKSSLKKGDGTPSASNEMDFIQPGGVSAVSVELPKDLYPNTDLSSASFLVNVNKNVSEAECGQFALPKADPSDKSVAQPSKLALDKLEFQEIENISGDEATQSDTKYYHLFQNNACYEFALGLSTQGSGDDETVTPVDREKVFRRLETILASVKIKPAEPVSQVAATTAPVPAAPADSAPASTAQAEVSK